MKKKKKKTNAKLTEVHSDVEDLHHRAESDVKITGPETHTRFVVVVHQGGSFEGRCEPERCRIRPKRVVGPR